MAQEGSKLKFGGIKQNLGAGLKNSGAVDKPVMKLGVQVEEEKRKGVFVDSVDLNVQKRIQSEAEVETGKRSVEKVIPVEPNREIVRGQPTAVVEENEDVTAAIKYLKSRENDEVDTNGCGAAPDDEDYEEMGIEDFGLAMLRGMGWKDGDGVGLTNKMVVADVDIGEAAFGRLGVGADSAQKRAAAAQEEEGREAESYEVKRARAAREMEKLAVKVDRLAMKVGSAVEILFGPNKGCFGRVRSLKGGEIEWETAIVQRAGPLPADAKLYIPVKRGEVSVVDEFALPSDHVLKS